MKDFQIVYRKGVKTTQEWLAKTNIDTIDSSNIDFYGSYECERICIDC